MVPYQPSWEPIKKRATKKIIALKRLITFTYEYLKSNYSLVDMSQSY